MKFFNDKKETVSIISKVTKKRIALFENGEFETDNPDVIEKLKPHFRYENPKVLSNMAHFLKLRQEAKEKGINTYKLKKHEIEEILKSQESFRMSEN